MEYSNKNPENERLSEPQATYGEKKKLKLRIFNSFQDQENEMIDYWASISPFQRLAHLYEMIRISFRLPANEHSNPKPPHTIRIIKYEP